MKSHIPVLVACAAVFLASPSHADDDWVVRVGAHVVDPTSDTGTLAGLKATTSNDAKPTFSVEYMITPHWGVDALAAVPFRHEVRLDGMKAATTKDLPPTLGVNYHFMPGAVVSPFIGAGINYTHFFDTRGEGVLNGASVHIQNSWGAAAHGGIDVKLTDRWLVTADLRWMDIRGTVHVNGANVGRATIDPIAYGLSVGYRF
ncbi:MAG TPA: OmpW family outer membrane protein [Dyella sp.]|uniref:OmpW/AlkL family protein n=1 Tax=Dyella sp. TaxID=1869338 RepID=UPI002B7E28EF|nr:OmpW family outer membrane protein [Dyella sp.]HTV84661.1 OmpW family outer membrane protein [Dyella sp.]